jgi:anti-sigma regulatory factor (Ser/Thr protein kinase)
VEQAMLWSHETVLAADAVSAAKARAFVVQQLVEHRLLYLVDEVRLVASELATNAIVHARTSFTVTLEGREHSVLLIVRDRSPAFPASHQGAPNDIHISGRGLLIVNLMSHTWGVADQDDTAKSVWASFETRPRAVS